MNGIEFLLLVPLVIFLSGMLTQSFLMLSGRWEKGDIKRLFQSFGFGLIAMLPLQHEVKYSFLLHLMLSMILGAFIFTFRFRKKLLVHVNGQIILIWNLLFLAVVLNHYDVSLLLCIIFGIPSLCTLINSFSDIDKSFGWQVFFHTWFSVMVVTIALFQFGSHELLKETTKSLGTLVFDIFSSGLSSMYILVNIWYLIGLIPWPSKHQSFHDRMRQVRAHARLLASGYIWVKDNVFMNFMLVIVLSGFFFLNHQYHFIGESRLITYTLIFTSIISYYGRYKTEQGDVDNKLNNLSPIANKIG